MSGAKVDILDPLIAAETSVNAALIFQKIKAFCAYHQAEKTHLNEGRHWCYNTVEGFTELLPYLTPKQVRGALDKLEAAGLIVTGNFNKYANDRTKWYALGDRFHANLNDEKQADQDADPSAPEGKWKPGPSALEGNSTFAREGNSASAPEGNSYTQKTQESLKTPPNPPKGGIDRFDELWDTFPPARRGYQARAQSNWDALSSDEQDLALHRAGHFITQNPDKTVNAYIRMKGWEFVSVPVIPERPEDPDMARVYDFYAENDRLTFWACWLSPGKARIEGDKIIPASSALANVIAFKPEVRREFRALRLTLADPDRSLAVKVSA